MSSTTDLLTQAEATPAKAESLYKQILAEDPSTSDAQVLRDKETALVKLGELYRDRKCVWPSYQDLLRVLTKKNRDAQALAGVITLSRSFMSSTAKAKTAKLSTLSRGVSHIKGTLTYDTTSPDPPRLLLRYTEQPKHPNQHAHR